MRLHFVFFLVVWCGITEIIYGVASPTKAPTYPPTVKPSTAPTYSPTTRTPTPKPTKFPTSQPSSRPSRQPVNHPSHKPSRQPTSQPTKQPFNKPSGQPSRYMKVLFITCQSPETFLYYSYITSCISSRYIFRLTVFRFASFVLSLSK